MTYSTVRATIDVTRVLDLAEAEGIPCSRHQIDVLADEVVGLWIGNEDILDDLHVTDLNEAGDAAMSAIVEEALPVVTIDTGELVEFLQNNPSQHIGLGEIRTFYRDIIARVIFNGLAEEIRRVAD